ncbi:regulatory protein RecX [Pimelobacter simplex]|uniref:Regulatory protein RecX n=1 Tax=Nocardioides simplex TaxID=2045 RepID=A0A7J5DYN8_NOCSI|nr:regulatory protein RecX [Pimelobacter simplex]KAB2811110.1 regulatory protein RecX [Pimelobacter simplex]
MSSFRPRTPIDRTAEPPDEDEPGWTEDADPESVARKILLDQLSIKARSRRELEERLARRKVPEEVASRLLDRFEEVGLVDDEAFARAWVEGRRRSRGLARTALAVELRRKGIADETAREVLDEVEPGAEEEAARALVRKKLRSMRGLDEQVAARRLVGMLARKGYGAGLAHAVVRSELGAVAGAEWSGDDA